LFFRDRQQTSVDVFECWEVRWYSRDGQYYTDIKPEIRVFPSKKDAIEFHDALVDAFNLIKHTSGTQVTLRKQE
jgi:hypothetical protein